MKSKDEKNEDGSDQEREYLAVVGRRWINHLCYHRHCFGSYYAPLYYVRFRSVSFSFHFVFRYAFICFVLFSVP